MPRIALTTYFVDTDGDTIGKREIHMSDRVEIRFRDPETGEIHTFEPTFHLVHSYSRHDRWQLEYRARPVTSLVQRFDALSAVERCIGVLGVVDCTIDGPRVVSMSYDLRNVFIDDQDWTVLDRNSWNRVKVPA